MSVRDARRARLLRALGRCKSVPQATSCLRRAGVPLDAELAELLFREFHRVLLTNPVQAESLIHALDGLARLHRDPLVDAWRNRARGTAQHVRGASRAAARLLERAALQLRRADRRVDAGDVHRVLVDVYGSLGNDRLALRAAGTARRAYARKTPERRRRVADLEMNLGVLHTLRDRWLEALRCFESAESALIAHGDPSRIGKCLMNQAMMLSVLDRRDEARAQLRRARELAETQQFSSQVRACDYHLAELDLREGDLDAAMAQLEHLVSANHEAGSPIHAGHCLLELAESALQSNLATRALAAARAAGKIFTKARYPAQRWQAASIEAAALTRTGQHAVARTKLNAAIVGQSALRNRVGAATHRLQLAALELSAAKPRRALELAHRASAVLARSGSELRLAKALGIRARAELALKRFAAAERSAARAVRAAERSGSRRARLESQLAVALVSQARGDRSGAFREFVKAERLVEQIRLGLSREDSRLAFLVDKIDLYEQLIRNRLAVGSPAAIRQALHFAERGKARTLAERLMSGVGKQVGSSISRSALKRRLSALDRDLAAAESQLGEAQQTPGLRRTLAPRVTRLSRERLSLLDSIARLSPAEAHLQGLAPRQPLALLDRLSSEQVVLEYVATGDALHLFVAQKGALRVYENHARVSDVSRLVEQLRFHLGKGVLGDAHQERFGAFNSRACRHYLSRLEQLLIGPEVRPQIRSSLRIVPHGVLYGVPFHALEHDDTSLIERTEISYVPSLAVAGWLDQRTPQPITGPPLVLGVPDAATPQILEEVQAIQRRLPHAEVLTGPEVTRTALLDRSSGRAVTHIACHGFYQDSESAVAGLKLGDAWVGLNDLAAAQGSSDLVILSGCETGRGTVLTGDEWLGLATGFLRSGARTVIAALWELHDASAASLMSDFYAAFVSGQTAAAAMAHAQRRARSNDPSPLRWAPFAVIGDPFYTLHQRMAA